MFPAGTNMGGMNLAFPDVCKTPIPPAGPIPLPYPNIAQNMLTNPATASFRVLVQCGMSQTIMSMPMMSNGDEPGVAGGVVSNMFIGPAKFSLGSVRLLTGGMPQVRMTSTTMQNGMAPNAVAGLQSVPSQIRMLCV